MSEKILVLYGREYAEAISGLGEISFSKDDFMKNPRDYKLVMFTGGEDVDPAMYGHTSPNHMCYYNTNRDIEEAKVFELALRYKIKMTGICRGSQFLNVMSGGTMMHHIDHHGSSHTMVCGDSGEAINVTSTHHQMCLPSEDGFVVAWSKERRSTVYHGDKDKKVQYDGPEVEGICYPTNRIFAVQYHPEYMEKDSHGYHWYKKAVADLLFLNMKEFVKKYTAISYEKEKRLSM